MKEVRSINFSFYQAIGGCVEMSLDLNMIGIAFEGLDKLRHGVDHRHDDLIVSLLQITAVAVQLPGMSLHRRETVGLHVTIDIQRHSTSDDHCTNLQSGLLKQMAVRCACQRILVGNATHFPVQWRARYGGRPQLHAWPCRPQETQCYSL